MTTREPDDEQLKVGIMAMKTALEADQDVPPVAVSVIEPVVPPVIPPNIEQPV
jgi:uncharacterized protein YqhQ